jgi:putative endonuclease
MGSRFGRLRARHLRTGRRGEDLAAQALAEYGLDVLVRNYRTSRGEVDLVCRENGTLCFVEVKTRRGGPELRPGQAVGPRKRKRIQAAARHYLRALGSPLIPYRFDVVEIVLAGPRILRLRHVPRAW